ncbi:diol dehydratase small subunit [Afifella sp. YEN Y35]|uniref:diol dehydratase small subunit n=1 Tax=Afifella sp. YEN Y35 TaxID=3388337 RepID=UPI0039E1D16E
MSQQDLINSIVREVLAELGNGGSAAAPSKASASGKLDHTKDYPLAKHRPELVKTPGGKSLEDITLEDVLNGKIGPNDIRITADTLEYQAQIGESVGRPQFAANLRRAAEMTRVPDDRILQMYNALRPNRSTKAELLAIADELESKFNANICADFVREAADVYERRDVLRKD